MTLTGEFGFDGDDNAARIIREAVAWRLERIHPDGSSDTAHLTDFEQVCIAWLIESEKGRGNKCSIRAIDARGNATGVHPNLLVGLLHQWREKHGISQHAAGEPKGASLPRVRIVRRKGGATKGERVRRHK